MVKKKKKKTFALYVHDESSGLLRPDIIASNKPYVWWNVLGQVV